MRAEDTVQNFDFSSIPGFIHWLAQPGTHEKMDPSLRLRRILLVTLAVLMSIGGLLWGTMALSVGAHLQSAIPYGYVLITLLNLTVFRLHQNFFVTSQIQLALSLLLPFLFQWSLGGGRSSGAMMLWGILALVGALLVRSGKALYWIISFVFLAALSAVLEPYLRERFTLLNEGQQVFALTLNICVIMMIVFGLMVYFIQKLDYSEYLETLVAKKTLEVRTQLETTRSLLDGLKQAVFSIDKTGTVVAPVSSAARSVLGINIEGRLLDEVIIEGVPSLRGRGPNLNMLIRSVFDFNEEQWLTTEEQLPQIIQYYGPQHEEPISLRLQYSPLWGQQGELDKVIIVAEDITGVLKLERAVEVEKEVSEQRVRMVRELASNSVMELQDYFRKLSIARMDLDGRILSKADPNENIKSMIQVLHRMKGEAQILKLKILADELHRLESFFVSLLGTFLAGKLSYDEVIDQSRSELQKLDLVVELYYELASQLLRVSLVSTPGVPSMLRMDIAVAHWTGLKSFLRKARIAGERVTADVIEEILDNMIGQPIEAVLERFEQVIEETSERIGKKARLVVSADSLKISPLLVAPLKEILLHLIRNSLDHGIESPEDRRKQGKDIVGRIRITASRENDVLNLVFKDDGRGISLDDVTSRAVKTGLISKEEASKLDENQKANLIFFKGLSTKENVTEYSGRGMGMDIVRSVIHSYAGTISLSSRPNEGIEFRIRLPAVESMPT
jgi:signal transduction histidine kinase/PAS domain-containing protein